MKDAEPLYEKLTMRLKSSDPHPDRCQVDNTETSIRIKRGKLDYTLLYKFLFSHVGYLWSEVFDKALNRIEDEAKLYNIVFTNDDKDIPPIVATGFRTYFSSLFVGDDGVLCMYAPRVTVEKLHPCCQCCVHTLNGVRFVKLDPMMSQDDNTCINVEDQAILLLIENEVKN